MLQIKRLKVGYDDVPAIHDVSLEVKEGEIVSIVGANGAGKTTLLRAISGIVPPMSGSITFEGKSLTDVRAHEIVPMGIAHVPEGRMLFARMTVEQNLVLGAFTKKEQEEREAILEQIYRVFPRLKERSRQAAGTMSGGEQQMLAIARGMMSKPKLLMLDEPSLGIAPKLVDEIFELITDINKLGTTVLLVEQKVREALELAHRAYVLQTGRIVLSGDAEEVMNSDTVKSAYLGM